MKSICLYFDTRPRQITLAVKRNPKQPAGGGDLKEAWRTLDAYVLEELLPSIGGRDVKESDFER
ncbi:MAG TPA: hypothetical protein VN736_05655 [Candidatus Limnocylindrales bacterium]|nr:hypothetical protein [Candidatus Limnocylindrales bacterium]